MIVFISTPEHLYTHERLHHKPSMPRIERWDYNSFLKRSNYPVATYVMTDFDRLHYSFTLVAAKKYREILAQLGPGRVLNDPARVMTRFTLLRALYDAGINSFNAYRVTSAFLPRYPVFLRLELDHRYPPLSDLLHSKQELDQAIGQVVDSGMPERHLLVVEYCSEPVGPGIFRRLAAFRIGHAVVPVPTAHDTSWFAKGQKGVATQELLQEDYNLVTNNPFRDLLDRVFEIARVDYGRADFNLVNGKVEVYEINTNPLVGTFGDQPEPIRARTESYYSEEYCRALRALDCE